jgi:hypothetical protein
MCLRVAQITAIMVLERNGCGACVTVASPGVWESDGDDVRV